MAPDPGARPEATRDDTGGTALDPFDAAILQLLTDRPDVLRDVPGSILTGSRRHRLPGHASFCFPGTSGEAVLIELGMGALEKADQIRPNHFDTLSYLNLLWREVVKVEVDPFKQQDLIAEADKWRNQAMALLKKSQPKPPASAS